MLTDEQRTEVMELAKAMVEEVEKAKIQRKITTGHDPDNPQAKQTGDRLAYDPKGGYGAFWEFAKDLHSAGPNGLNASEKLRAWGQAVKAAGHMEEGDMGQGGYLVPLEFSNQLLLTALEDSIVRPRAVHMPMATNRLAIPAVVDASHATTLWGGVQIYRPGEAEQKTATKPALGRITLTLHKLTGLIYLSDELLEDSPISLEPLLTRMFGDAIAFTEDDDFLQGNGANQALGAFNGANPSLIAVAKEAGQAATTIVTENIVKMWARLHPRSGRNAVWIANNDCFPQLAMMSMAVGTGGVPVWMPAGGISGLPFQTLMGRPLLYSEKMQTLGTQGDIGLADFSQYLIGDKGGIKVATSIHLRFDYDETAFRFVLRYDGQPWWLSALTPRRGTSTLSPFVVLAVRA